MILSDTAIQFRIAVFVFIFVLIVGGGISYVALPREGNPDITIPYVFVTAFYEGTAPQEMEKRVTVQLEKKLNEVENVKEMRTTTQDSLSLISIEFLAGADIEQARLHVKDKVDLAKPDLPEDLDEPIVEAINFSSDIPIFRFSLSGDTDLERLKNLAEEFEDQLELLPGVKEVDISGTREREIRVEMDLQRLVAYDVPISLVMNRIAQENKTISAGNIEMAGNKFQVRIPGEFTMAAEMKQILLAERDGKPVYLTDVATINDTFKDVETISRVNGKLSVSLAIKKRTGENTVWLVAKVREVMDQFLLPPGVALTIVFNEADYVDSIITELENNIASGFILVVIVLLFFMGWKNSLFVGIAIPLSMLLAFLLMAFWAFTLNMVVLFSLVLAVGMLVDNAIVVVENIYRHRTEGLSKREAARIGAAEVAWPVITSTLTTLAAFSPLLFWPGIIGQFMGFMPQTLIVVLSASLFVAIVINPAVCSALISAGRKKLGNGVNGEGDHAFIRGYEKLLRTALRHRVPVFLIGLAFLYLTAQVYGIWGKGTELFPDVEPRNCIVDIKYPQGTSVERVDATLREIEAKLYPFMVDYTGGEELSEGVARDVEFFLTIAGESGASMMGGERGSHLGHIHLEFLDHTDRKGNSTRLVDHIRDLVGQIPGAEVKVEKEQEGPDTGAPISIEVSGDDFETLGALASDIERRIADVPGLVDLQDDFEETLPEIQFQVDRKRAALLGLDTDTIGLFLRTSIYGLETSKFRPDEDEYDITLRLPEKERSSFNVLDCSSIPTQDGRIVPLSSVGRVVYTSGLGAIRRKDQKRTITISGNNQVRGVDEIIADIKPSVTNIPLSRGYKIHFAGDTEEMANASAFLSKAFMIALALILIILVLQFNSLILPLIIVFSVLLSLVGVMWGLLICGMRFGVIMTGVGVISLAGIVVNNAIVLVDCILQREAAGLPMVEAIVDAGRTRLRPVLLTAVTTILGLIPMAVGYSLEVHHWPPKIISGAESSAWWAPMAVAVIFGLALATVLTLVLVPVMYSLAHSIGQFFNLGISDD